MTDIFDIALGGHDLAAVNAKLDRILALLENPKPRPQRVVSGRGNAIAYSDGFEQIWKIYPKRAGNNVKAEAYQQFNARVRNGATVLSLKAATELYRDYCAAVGSTGSQYVMEAKRFFGVNKPYEQEWELPEVKVKGPQTDDEWIALGRKLGKEARPGESMYEFKQRLQPRSE